MKNDLIKILNFKLKSIEDNIEQLKVLNDSINNETDGLKYIENAINLFNAKDGGFDINNFSKLNREDFNKLLMELDDSVLTKFGTNTCNYDGLIYLIEGINNGVLLSLTKEQSDAINYLIDKLLEKQKEYNEIIEKLNAKKQELEIRDLDVLTNLQNNYLSIIDKLEDDKYVNEIDLVVEALNYNDLEKENIYELLCYLLKYNAEAFAKNKESEETKEEVKEEKNGIDLTIPFEEQGFVSENEPDENEFVSLQENDTLSDNNDTLENNVDENVENNDALENETSEQNEAGNIVDDNTKESSETTNKDSHDEINLDFLKVDEIMPNGDNHDEINLDEVELPPLNIENDLEKDEDFSDLSASDYEDYNPALFNDETLDKDDSVDQDNINEVDDEQDNKENKDDTNIENELQVDDDDTELEKTNEETLDENKIDIPVDFDKEEKENTQTVELTLDELKPILDKYSIKQDKISDELIDELKKGNISNYQEVLDKLKELNVLDFLEKDLDVLVKLMLHSNKNIIDEIIRIVGSDLSVDNDDKKTTTEIIFKTMPSVFIDGKYGNYQEFISNIALFKEYGVDLINLFDFSKEVFIANTDHLANNYKIVRDYDLKVNDHNLKYLLLLPNINEKLDYYVEASYKDNLKGSKGEVFEGTDYIKLYPNKLNIVCDETIKRLRYSSENGKKVFGSKEKSLAGEITNMKVDILNIPNDYLHDFFNNEFDIIPRDEVMEYEKIIKDSNYVSLDVDDYIKPLEKMRDGLRYNIEGIKVSRNKVLRNYNILINHDVEKEKAILFAVCYNLIVLKDEYNKIKDYLAHNLGGN